MEKSNLSTKTQKHIVTMFGFLNAQECMALTLLYGKKKKATNSSVAKIMRVSTERIRQSQWACFRKLKKYRIENILMGLDHLYVAGTYKINKHSKEYNLFQKELRDCITIFNNRLKYLTRNKL